MVRALVLKSNPSPDERENAKWQTLQVSTLSIGNCIGRILIGIHLPGLLLFHDRSNFSSDRCDCRLWEAQRNEACLVHLYGGRVVHSLSVGRPRCSGHRAPTICGHPSWDFVRWGLWPHTDHHDRMVWNGCAQSFVSVRTAETNLPFGIHFYATVGSLHTANFSENWGFVSLCTILVGNVFSVIFGRVFDAHSSHSGDGIRCLDGVQCYSASLYVTTWACICALILALVAAKRDKKYR